MATLYLLKYNNYYNKICRQKASISDYEEASESSYMVTGVNFNPNDGVHTEVVINMTDPDYDPDYLLVTEDNAIISRWFVMEHVFTTYKQYKMQLMRDVLVDFKSYVDDSVAYIRRANLSADNPLIYNNEGIRFNQIKQSESLLYDITGTPWIVGYMAANYADDKTISVASADSAAALDNYDDLLEMTAQDLQVVSGNPTIIFNTYKQETYVGATVHQYSITCGSSASRKYISSPGGAYGCYYATNDVTNNITNYFKTRSEQVKSYIVASNTKNSLVNTYIGYNGRIVKDSSGNYYKVIVTNTANKSQTDTPRAKNAATNAYFNNISNMIWAIDGISKPNSYDPGAGTYVPQLTVSYTVSTWHMVLQPISYGELSVHIPGTIKPLTDAPYYMFAMKYSADNLRLAIQMAKDLTASFIYDIQILPYCPCQEYFSAAGVLVTTGLTEGVDYSPITKGTEGDTLDYLLWCAYSNFTFDIKCVIDIDDIKQATECDMYRLCSPNGNGVFEFNAAKNGGVALINVDCTYRPIDPYIHMNPNFNNLYGGDYNDFRGLILQGDFSIPQINDKWQEYQVQNKNYLNIFNREIQNLTTIQNIQRKQEIASWISGAVGAGASGAGAGMMVGGPIGGIIGGVAGAGVSAIGGALDFKYNEQLRAEQLSFKQDMFEMQLQNIQALPYSIAKTGCMTYNNKLLPYLEYYTCTDAEKEMLANKIKYTGMSAGVVGTIKDYYNYNGDGYAYIEADLIHIDLHVNYTILMEIARALREGVRFTEVIDGTNSE